VSRSACRDERTTASCSSCGRRISGSVSRVSATASTIGPKPGATGWMATWLCVALSLYRGYLGAVCCGDDDWAVVDDSTPAPPSPGRRPEPGSESVDAGQTSVVSPIIWHLLPETTTATSARNTSIATSPLSTRSAPTSDSSKPSATAAPSNQQPDTGHRTPHPGSAGELSPAWFPFIMSQGHLCAARDCLANGVSGGSHQ
jgi:hypothetical protein